MSLFWEVFRYYNKPFKGLFYMPARWLIVPFQEIESHLPKEGTIIDIGCGEGVLATLLARTAPRRKVIGIDINPKKIRLARSISLKIPNLSFRLQDVLYKNLPKSKAYVLSDFLHHLSASHHQKFLKNLIKNLEKKGLIIIKEIDSEDKFRSKISRFFDFIFYPFQKVYFLKAEEVASFFRRNGLKVKIVRSKKWFPGSTILIICRK